MEMTQKKTGFWRKFIGDKAFYKMAVSYTHLDVYKRQVWRPQVFTAMDFLWCVRYSI